MASYELCLISKIVGQACTRQRRISWISIAALGWLMRPDSPSKITCTCTSVAVRASEAKAWYHRVDSASSPIQSVV